MLEIITRLAITGIIISILFSIYGSIIIWKKNSYFSDGLAHACLLGVVLQQVFAVNILVAVYLVAIGFAFVIHYLSFYQSRNINTQIASQSFLALAIILAGIYKNNFNISDFFLGNLLLVDNQDIFSLTLITIITVIWLVYFYRNILLLCISNDIANAYSIRINHLNIFFTFLLATIVAITIKILGSLLVTSMLIIPPIAARIISSNPKTMIVKSIIISLASYYLSLYISFMFDLAVVPLIVIINFAIYIFLQLFYKAR